MHVYGEIGCLLRLWCVCVCIETAVVKAMVRVREKTEGPVCKKDGYDVMREVIQKKLRTMLPGHVSAFSTHSAIYPSHQPCDIGSIINSTWRLGN